MGRVVIKNGKFPQLTEEQKREVEEAMTLPIDYSDIPSLSDEELERMRRVSESQDMRISI